MPKPLEYIRVFADELGESHIEKGEVEMETKCFAPPAPPLDVSASQEASGFAILRLPEDWWGEWHPSPYRQWLFFMSGTATIFASDGSQWNIAPGSIVFLEDTHGRGHQTRVTGGQELLVASVQPNGQEQRSHDV